MALNMLLAWRLVQLFLNKINCELLRQFSFSWTNRHGRSIFQVSNTSYSMLKLDATKKKVPNFCLQIQNIWH